MNTFFLLRIGSEKQYSIELTWNNGFKEEIPSSMLNQQQHGEQALMNSTSSSTESSFIRNLNANSMESCPIKQLHPPVFSKRINIFSDASPFAALSQHSVMSDLYGSLLSNHSVKSKKFDLDFNDLDDGFGSLSSASLSSTYPTMSNSSHPRCPFSMGLETGNVLEMDYGTSYYRTHFRDFEHQNWLQMHDKYGPIIVSIRKERLKNVNFSSSTSNNYNSNFSTRWRVIVRTTSLIPLRGSIASLPLICLPNCSGVSSSLNNNSSRRSSTYDAFNINSVRDVLSLVVPKSVNVSNFR